MTSKKFFGRSGKDLPESNGSYILWGNGYVKPSEVTAVSAAGERLMVLTCGGHELYSQYDTPDDALEAREEMIRLLKEQQPLTTFVNVDTQATRVDPSQIADAIRK